jgi:hypothetical protein
MNDKAPEPAVMAQFMTYMSCSELFKLVPTRARLEAEIAQLPTDWVVRICGFLEYVRDSDGPLGGDLQREALGTFVPQPLRKDLLKHHAARGDVFLIEYQLLGIMKFAMLGGSGELPDVISAAAAGVLPTFCRASCAVQDAAAPAGASCTRNQAQEREGRVAVLRLRDTPQPRGRSLRPAAVPPVGAGRGDMEIPEAMVVPGLAEAVDAAIKTYAGQERTSNRQARRRNIDDRLKRLAELFEMGDITKIVYVSRKNDLLIERNQLEAQPAAASVALQRDRIGSIVDDWAVMTDEERKRIIQMIFVEIRADHTPDGLKVEFKARAAWEPLCRGGSSGAGSKAKRS